MSQALKSYGGVPKAAIAAAMDAPFGHSENIIREFVPDFTMLNNGHTVYDIEILASGSVTIRVSAPSRAAAQEIAQNAGHAYIDIDFDLTLKGVSSNQGTPPDLVWSEDD